MSDQIDQFDQGGAAPPHLLVQPERSWKGKELRAYSFARRLLTRLILKNDPTDEVWVIGVIYVLSLTDQEVANALYAPAIFKEELFRFIDAFDDSDYKSAADLAAAVLSEAKRAEVKVREDGGPQKKT